MLWLREFGVKVPLVGFNLSDLRLSPVIGHVLLNVKGIPLTLLVIDVNEAIIGFRLLSIVILRSEGLVERILSQNLRI